MAGSVKMKLIICEQTAVVVRENMKICLPKLLHKIWLQNTLEIGVAYFDYINFYSVSAVIIHSGCYFIEHFEPWDHDQHIGSQINPTP